MRSGSGAANTVPGGNPRSRPSPNHGPVDATLVLAQRPTDMHLPSPRNHRAQPGTRHRACRVLAAMLVSLFPASAAAPPPTLFVKACAPCHGKDGKASTPAARAPSGPPVKVGAG